MSHRTIQLLGYFIKIQQFSISYPEEGHIILTSHFKKKSGHYLGINMLQSRNGNVTCMKITKIYLLKVLIKL